MTSRGMKTAVVVCLALFAGCSGTDTTATTPSGAEASSSGAAPSQTAGAEASATPSTRQTPTPMPTPVPPPASAHPVGATTGPAASLTRLQVGSCTGMTQGTGFFVGPDLVLTAAQLFDGAASISVRGANGVVRGALLGKDAATGVALVKVLPTGDGGRLSAPPLTLATKDAAEGTSVTMVGLPTAKGPHQAAGKVGQTDQSVEPAGSFAHDANAQPGVSGAPLLDASGKVVGLEIATAPDGAGAHHAVPSSALAKAMAAWRGAKPMSMAKCQQDGPPSMTSIHPDAPAIRNSMRRLLWGLSYPSETDETGNTGQDIAWQYLDQGLQRKHKTPAGLVGQLKGARVGAANVDNLEIKDEFTDTLLWTVQLEGPGKACKVLHQRVVLSSAPGRWVVTEVSDTQPPTPC